jgi:hypothetical protein
MEAVWNFLKQPFAWGLFIGLFVFCFSAWGHFKTKRELSRYKKLLSDKLELEARQYETIRKERDTITKENENLRVRIQQLGDKPEQKLLRDLEIYARAEKLMIMQAPGFGGAWEVAKTQASEQMAEEDSGKSLPKRLFNRLFGNGAVREALPAESTTNPS